MTIIWPSEYEKSKENIDCPENWNPTTCKQEWQMANDCREETKFPPPHYTMTSILNVI